MRQRKYAFIVPRYYEGIAGGAETLVGNLATHLKERGDCVELWATCARDNRSWENSFPAGSSIVDGLPVTRFAVDDRDLDTWIPIQIAMHQGEEISLEDQLAWMRESVNSKSLYEHISARAESYDALFFGPYLFGTTLWGSLIAPEKSVLIPCLHDESYAYQDVVASMFRQVRGCLFNAEPEMILARSIYGEIPGGVVGMGFSPPEALEVEALTPYFTEGFPYILYLGRKETGKNVHLLIDAFCEAKEAGLIPNEVKLAILGGGSFDDLHRGEALTRGDVVDLPHVSELDKRRLLKHALYLCQPSTNESFSIVIMESWMVGTPVVVHAKCEVTRHHVIESGGGLYFSSPLDLAGVTRFYLSNPAARAEHANAGGAYVRREYAWSAVLNRFDSTVGAIFEKERPRSVAS